MRNYYRKRNNKGDAALSTKLLCQGRGGKGGKKLDKRPSSRSLEQNR